jgi:hypothetical protein
LPRRRIDPSALGRGEQDALSTGWQRMRRSDERCGVLSAVNALT